MSKSYHNTTNETDKLDQYEQKAKTQDEKILEYFQEMCPRQTYFSPSELQGVLKTAPLTSIRRALSNLTRLDALIRTDVKKDGLYGRKEHCWKLKSDQLELNIK